MGARASPAYCWWRAAREGAALGAGAAPGCPKACEWVPGGGGAAAPLRSPGSRRRDRRVDVGLGSGCVLFDYLAVTMADN